MVTRLITMIPLMYITIKSLFCMPGTNAVL